MYYGEFENRELILFHFQRLLPNYFNLLLFFCQRASIIPLTGNLIQSPFQCSNERKNWRQYGRTPFYLPYSYIFLQLTIYLRSFRNCIPSIFPSLNLAWNRVWARPLQLITPLSWIRFSLPTRFIFMSIYCFKDWLIIHQPNSLSKRR